MIEIVHGDCLDVFRGRSGLGAIVSDLPSGTGFMGRGWDQLPIVERNGALAREDAFSEYWAERLDVARSACVDDAVALIWALPRTVDLTMRAVRFAGWRIQDVIVHVFGQGWPKSRSALKPAQEMWILARKGSPDLGIDDCRVERGSGEAGTRCSFYPGRCLGHGASNSQSGPTVHAWPPVDRSGSWPTNFVMSHAEGCCRAGMRQVSTSSNGVTRRGPTMGYGGDSGGTIGRLYGNDGAEALDAWACVAACDCGAAWLAMAGGPATTCAACGRQGWWACPVAEMDAQSGVLQSSGGSIKPHHAALGYGGGNGSSRECIRDSGGASRFFPTFGYYAKAPPGERHAGCEDLFWRADRKDPFGWIQITRAEYEATEERETAKSGSTSLNGRTDSRGGPLIAQGNVHPTVKRIALMRWLHRLAAPKGPIGDLCAGSGSGAVAAILDGYDWIGAEVCPQAITIANARLDFWRGLTPSARGRFCESGEMPERIEADSRQVSLFGGAL